MQDRRSFYFTGTVFVFGMGILLVSALALVTSDGAFLHKLVKCLFAVLIFQLVEQASISFEVQDKKLRWSATGIPQFFFMIVFGPAITVIASAISLLIHDNIQRTAELTLKEKFLNAGEYPLTIGVTVWTYSLLGGQAGQMDLPGDFLPLWASMMVYTTLNIVIILMLEGVISHPKPMAELKDQLAQSVGPWLDTLFEMSLGIVLAAAYLISPWAMALVLPLTIALYQSVRNRFALRSTASGALKALADIVDERDHYTYEHSVRVCTFSMQIGQAMGLTSSQLQRLYWTSRLHDLGKIAVPNRILQKPFNLTDEEFELMKSHTTVSAAILKSFSFGEEEAKIVRCHHERYDGNGYWKLNREEVPLESFIISVADTYDAMTTTRSYRKGLSRQVALAEISNQSARQLHPEVVRVFLDLMGGEMEVRDALDTETDLASYYLDG